MSYYTVSKPTTSFYTVTVAAKTWYESSIFGIHTWLRLSQIDARTWFKLSRLFLTTWARLDTARGWILFYYLVDKPDASSYTVGNPSTTYYEVT